MFAEGAGRTRHLTQKEADRLLTACNPDFRVVVLVALHTGFRKSELQSLKWLNVDLINRSITVESCYSKNGRARAVPMTKDVFKVLKQLQSERDRSPEDFVLINRYGKPWSSWRTAFVNAVERAGLKDFRFHDLRHCYGSWLAMNGTTDTARMELMGHLTHKMTVRYSHLSMDHKRQEVARLPSFDITESRMESPQISPLAKVAKVAGFTK